MLIIFNVIFIAFIWAIIIFIREYRAKKKLHLEELKTIDLLHKEELLKTQMEIQTQTMKHIGREIHDNVGQKLTLSSLYLQQLVFENKTLETHERINTVNDIINESLVELRHLSMSLTNDNIKTHSISTLIEKECERVRNLKTYLVTFKSDPEIPSLSQRIKSVLLRIVQEFLQNSMKHAECRSVAITLARQSNKIQLMLTDDGKGFDMENMETKGVGLKSMQKRVEMINGLFILESKKGSGTRLRIKIPV